MSESWRRKEHYKPRVLIDTGRVLNPVFDDQLLCITGPQLEMLRNLTQYLHRRSTFVSEYCDGYYLAPTNTEWDNLQAEVAELEDVLMGCEDIKALLQGIKDELVLFRSRMSRQQKKGPVMEPVIEQYLTGGEFQLVDDYGGDTVVDAKRCAVAQLVWQLCYELLTEVIQPLQESTVDILLPVAMVLLASWIGTPVLGIPAGVFVGLIWNIIEAWVEGSLESVRNTIISYQHELVCAVYWGLETDYRAAEAEAVLVIADMAGLSPIDKIVVHTLFAPWAIALAALAWNNQTAWAISNVESGYCDDCDIIEGVDWWARRLDEEAHTVTINHPEGANWKPGCIQLSVADGDTCVGIVFRVQAMTGDCNLKQMTQTSEEPKCTGSWIWTGGCEWMGNDTYFAVDPDTVDEEDCKETLCPEATDCPPSPDASMVRRSGPLNIYAAFDFGWACTGSCEIVATYQVFEGAP